MIVDIMSGGAGSRLWPVSREQDPKPFIRLSDGLSLLQKAYLRGINLPGVKSVITVTGRDHFFRVQDEYRELGEKGLPLTYILEPFGRNTAAAIATAALEVSTNFNPDETMLVLAADHLVLDQEAFTNAVAEAKNIVEKGVIVTFGVKPGSPETGYGYIQADGNEVKRFIEKPDIVNAVKYLESEDYLWNSGMFCFRAQDMLIEMSRYCPEILKASRNCFDKSHRTSGVNIVQIELDAVSFEQVPENSIDIALLEKTRQIAVVPCDIGWSDIGSWTALSELTQKDQKDNRVVGEALLIDTQNCYIQSSDRIVGTVGVQDLLIIDTPDALLVSTKKQAQDVKKIYSQLKLINHSAYKYHHTVHRPWGTYTVLEEGHDFKIKRIEVRPGASLSLQMHHHRSEHWIVVSGVARVINDDKEIILHRNESTYIEALKKHRLENISAEKLIMIEVQTGSYLGEDDIVRFSDIYGRVN